jgi:DNA polymerase I
MTDIQRLIYGKDPTEKIVGIEPVDDRVEIFIQNDDGSIKSEFRANKFWLLASKPLDKNFVRLKGDLHYKWGRQFSTRESWSKVKFMYSKEDIYAIYDPKEMTMINRGLCYYKGLKPKDVSILSFDIETTGFSGAADKLLLISNTFRNSAGVVSRRLFAYDEYESEGQMLEAWVKFVREQNPSIICGHNIYGFDLPFLQAVADRENVMLELGRDNSPLHFAHKDSQKRKDGSQSISYKKVRCYGRELIDTMFLAITYDSGRKYESYGLKKIIEQEGIRFEGRVLYDAGLIKDNYQKPGEWEKIKKYCIYDSDEALQLFDLMAPALFYLTQSVPKSFQSMIESATGAQINSVMVRSYLQEAHSLPKADERQNFEGAHSGGIPGIYKNCIKWDVASLYPSIMIEYEVCNWKKDPNGHFLSLVKTFTEERLKNKKLAKETGEQYYDDMQGAQKIFINSCYGFLGASGLLFNSLEHAAFITTTGREILEHAVKWATGRDMSEFVQKDEDEENE